MNETCEGNIENSRFMIFNNKFLEISRLYELENAFDNSYSTKINLSTLVSFAFQLRK